MSIDGFAGVLFYVSFFSLSAVLVAYGHRRKFLPITLIGLLIPILISGLRYGVGTDFNAYLYIYSQVSAMSLGDFFVSTEASLEVGFWLLVKLGSWTTLGSSFFFFLASALTVLLFYKGLMRYKVKNPGLLWFLYLLIILPMTMNLVRQGVAISAVFLAFSYISSRDFRKYLLWMLVAGAFHMSALILLPVYFINRLLLRANERVGRTLFKSLVGFLVILSILPVTFMLLALIPGFEKYAMYQDVIAEGGNITFYVKAVIMVLILLLYKHFIVHDKNNAYLVAFALFDLALTVVGFSSAFVKRISMYFSIYPLMLLVKAAVASPNAKNRIVGGTLVALYGVAFFIVSYYMLGQSEIFPYVTIFGRMS